MTIMMLIVRTPSREETSCVGGGEREREREREKRRLVWGEWRKWRSSGEGMRERKRERERECEEGDMCGECRKGRYSGEKKIYEKEREKYRGLERKRERGGGREDNMCKLIVEKRELVKNG